MSPELFNNCAAAVGLKRLDLEINQLGDEEGFAGSCTLIVVGNPVLLFSAA